MIYSSMQDLTSCRLYVCKYHFGGTYDCRKFATLEEYNAWSNDPRNAFDAYNSRVEPVCTNEYMKIFDRVVLAMRVRK